MAGATSVLRASPAALLLRDCAAGAPYRGVRCLWPQGRLWGLLRLDGLCWPCRRDHRG